jgi:hypothetical protein
MIDCDQLACLQSEHARLIALLDGRGIEWRLPHKRSHLNMRRLSRSHSHRVFPPLKKWRCFVGCFVAAPTSTQSAGKAKPPATLAMHRLAAMSGWRVFETSRVSSVASAITAC